MGFSIADALDGRLPIDCLPWRTGGLDAYIATLESKAEELGSDPVLAVRGYVWNDPRATENGPAYDVRVTIPGLETETGWEQYWESETVDPFRDREEFEYRARKRVEEIRSALERHGFEAYTGIRRQWDEDIPPADADMPRSEM